jgi:t-SNARE complex subunit (syntaxin)
VAGKYQDVLTLEQSVAELHQMFLDFALLTEQQGELLDQIEFQVKQAGDYVEEANVDVHQAIEYQKSIRKKQWYVCRSYCCSVNKNTIPIDLLIYLYSCQSLTSSLFHFCF